MAINQTYIFGSSENEKVGFIKEVTDCEAALYEILDVFPTEKIFEYSEHFNLIFSLLETVKKCKVDDD